MNASAAVHGMFRIPRAGPAFRQGAAGEKPVPQCGGDARVESIRNILRQGGHTVTQLSAATRHRYGTRSPYFIPPTFLYKLKSGVTPHVCQIAALSESTGYCFVDWLRMCGFDLQQIPRLQMRLHTERTVLVTPIADCPESFPPQPSPTFYETVWNASIFSTPRPGEGSGSRRYLFAKIGTGDALVYPNLPAGGVVRVDRCYAHQMRGAHHASSDDGLWLIEQPSGLTCSQVRWIDDRQIVLLPSRPPWGRWPLRLPTEARILGLVDMEVRPWRPTKLQPRAGPNKLEPPFPLHPREETMKFSELLRISRRRTGLTFRAAHRLTCSIAQVLGNREYAIALGLLSDYEAMGRLPRHIAKILSLCIVYCMDVRELMEAAGVRVDDSAKLPLPLPDGRLPWQPNFLEPAARLGPGAMTASYAQSAGSQA